MASILGQLVHPPTKQQCTLGVSPARILPSLFNGARKESKPSCIQTLRLVPSKPVPKKS